jgi:ATP-dependent DNA helicase RecQ
MRERFGTNLVAEVLKGSRNKKVLELRFDTLSTYGLMSDRSTQDIKDLINYLISEDYLRLSTGDYPVVKLGTEAIPVLKGESAVFQKVRKKIVHKAEESLSLFDHLRLLRREIASREGLPPYMIFGDSTLREMAETQPKTQAQFLRLGGVGERKLEKYGEIFLTAIQEYFLSQKEQNQRLRTDSSAKPAVLSEPEEKHDSFIQSDGLARAAEGSGSKIRDVGNTDKPDHSEDNSDDAAMPKKPDKTPSYLVSYLMYQEGKSLQEISQVRQCNLTTVQDHIIRAFHEGQPLTWSDFIPPGQEQLILNVVKQIGREKLRPIKDALPENIDWMTIKVVLAKNQG